MSKKKNSLSKDLLDMKLNESSEIPLQSTGLDLDLSDLDLGVSSDERSKTVASPGQKDNTLRLILPVEKDQVSARNQEQDQEDAVRISYGLPSKQQLPKESEFSISGVDGTLKQSEHLRIAQRKINDLEEEMMKLRKENEELASAAETFKRLNDEYYVSIESLKSRLSDQSLTAVQEIELLKKINQSKDKQIVEFKQQIEDFQSKFDNNFQRVRKREKDLEHRLEIAKIEEVAIVKSKDQLILDLKRRIDEISQESDNFRKKSQENYQELQKKQQVMRGVIRALRIALTKLEGDDSSDYGEDTGGGEDEL